MLTRRFLAVTTGTATLLGASLLAVRPSSSDVATGGVDGSLTAVAAATAGAAGYARMPLPWPAPHQPKDVSEVGRDMAVMVQRVQRDIVEVLSAIDGVPFTLDNWTTADNPNRMSFCLLFFC